MGAESEKQVVQLPPVQNESGQIVLRIVLLFSVYFENGFATDVRKRIATCLDQYRSLCGDSLRWMVNPGNKKWSRIDDVGIRTLYDALRYERWRLSWASSLQGGRNPQEASEYRVKVFANEGPLPELSNLQFVVPATWRGSSSPTAFLRDLCLPICETVRPYSGYGGYGFVSSPNMALEDEAQAIAFGLAQRFPGIEVERRHWRYLANAIKGVNWLTVLGSHWVEAMGGATKLRETLPAVATCHEYAGGVLIQAGDMPVTGDVNHRMWPTAYAEVAKALRPIRLREHGSFHNSGTGRFTRETSEQWLRRFDEPPPFEPAEPPAGGAKEEE